jgi:hypothetical protein
MWLRSRCCGTSLVFLSLALLSAVARAYPTSLPVRVAGLKDAAQIVTAGDTTCALRKNGRVMCWGDYAGLFGTGKVRAQSLPGLVPGLSDVLQIAGGSSRLCATHLDGRVSCWSRDAPKPVPGIDSAVQVAVGSDHACARLRSGHVVCWTDQAEAPLEVAQLANAVWLAAADARTCAARKNGEVVCWGAIEVPAQGCEPWKSATPKRVLSGSPPVALGAELSCAVKEATLACEAQCETVRVRGVKDALHLALHAHAGCVVGSTGTLHCFGGDIRAWGPWARAADTDQAVALPGISGAVQASLGTFKRVRPDQVR